MKTYQMTNEPNQEFTIDYDGSKMRIALRYSPLDKNWYAGIIGVVSGVKVVFGVPIFAQFGYGKLFFYNIDVDFGLQSIYKTFLVTATEDEIEGIVNPIVEATNIGVRIK